MAALPAGSLLSGPQLGWRPAIGKCIGWRRRWWTAITQRPGEGRWTVLGTLLRFYASTLLPLPLPHG